MQVTAFIRHAQFKKHFQKMSKDVQSAFSERIRIFIKQPSNIVLNDHPLHGEWSGYRSINITGNIRAIYKIQGTIAIFVEIGTHSQLYE